ncbi:MAG: lamin tail domain-containing protein [Anaerolineaceae bacterium]|jgi:hypothetical protein
MKFWKHIFPFLLLNILVSALTILVVLTLWERGKQTDTPFPGFFQRTTAPTPSNLHPAQDEPIKIESPQPRGSVPVQVKIEAVFGAGDLNVEYVLIRNQGSEPINLEGWTLQGSRKQLYHFPNLSLNSQGAVRLYSRIGTNSVIELFWGLDSALWESGETIQLKDSQGGLQATYDLP